MQLGFNMGVMSHGLLLAKEDGFQFLTDAREGAITMQVFREHVLSLVQTRSVDVKEENVAKPF